MSAATLVSQTFSRWNSHEGQRLGAALAFYTLLSAAPLLIFFLLAVSLFYGTKAVEREIIDYIHAMIGLTAAQLTESLLESARRPDHGTLAGLIGLATLMFGASGAFAELRDDLNKMWDARPPRAGIAGVLMQRIFAFLLVLVSGALLFGLMLISTAIAFIRRFFGDVIDVPPAVLDAANFVLSFAILTVVFALVFRFVPDRRLPWRVLWIGATVSATLAVIGKALLGWYLGRAGVGSAYGAAGSIVAIAFWLYYSAQIFLLGAEFTYVWARRGSEH